MHVSNWLNSRFSTIRFPIHGIMYLVMKMRISSRIYNFGFVSVAKSAFESHFPNSIIPGKKKIYSVKTFCSHQIWQIYITKYYFHQSAICFQTLFSYFSGQFLLWCPSTLCREHCPISPFHIRSLLWWWGRWMGNAKLL